MGGFNPIFFASSKLVANIFIGGVSSTINSIPSIASILNVSTSNVNLFKISGSDVECRVIVNCAIASSAFAGNTSLTYFKDIYGKCITVDGDQNFDQCINLTEVILPKLQLKYPATTNYILNRCPNLQKVDLSGTTYFTINTMGGGGGGQIYLTDLRLDNVVTWERAAINGSLLSVSVLNIKKCISFGETGDAVGFRGIAGAIKTGMIFNVNIALLTSNAGAVNADMAYYKATYGCVINFFDNSGAYVSTL